MTSYQTGGLHQGGVANPVGGQPGAMHPGTGTGMNPGMNTGGMNTGGMNTAPVAETQDTTRDRRNRSSTSSSTKVTKGDKVGIVEKAVNTYGRIMALLSILGALGAVLVYLGGLGALQKRSKDLGNGNTTLGYSETFQSSQQVPYPGSYSNQWAFQWYLGAIQFFVTMLCLFTLCLPQRILQRFKPATMVLLGYCLVLFTYEVQSLLFFKRNSLATGIFSRKRILVTLIGAICVAIFDGLTLLNLSLLKETNRDLFGGGGKRVAEEAHHSQTDDHDFDHERNVHHHGPGHHGANAV